MVLTTHSQRQMRGLALFLVFLSVLALVPGRPATAATATTITILDNDPAQFASGVFQRSAISTTRLTGMRGPNEPADDAAGAVQLSPAGTLKPWTLHPSELAYGSSDINVSYAGVTAVGTRIYVMGGATDTNDYNSDIYWADVNPQDGTLVGNAWHKDPNGLKADYVIQDSNDWYDDRPNCKTTLVSARSRHSTVSLATGTNTGYIYVIGGEFDTAKAPGLCFGNMSSPIVQRGIVNSDGSISWTTLTNAWLPSPATLTAPDPTRKLGVDSAASVIAQYRDSNGNDHYYLYVIGGKSNFVNYFGNISQATLRTVYYTKIDITNGNLVDPDTSDGDPSVWKRDSDIQLHSLDPSDPAYNTDYGLWEATASSTTTVVEGQLKSAIFLAGGAHNMEQTSLDGFIYRADVGPNGALNWGTIANETFGSNTVPLAGRLGMASLAYNNKLYLVSGRTSAANSTSSTASVPTMIMEDDLDPMYILDPNNPIIGPNTAVLGSNLDSEEHKRSYAGVALVRAEPVITDPNNPPPAINSAWVFVIGGNNPSGAETNTVYQGSIGGEETNIESYTLEGWYYANTFRTTYTFGGAGGDVYKKSRLLAFYWAIKADRAANANADVQIFFRTKQTASGDCVADNDKFKDSDPWRGPIDGYSGNDLYSKVPVSGTLYNKVSLEGLFDDSVLTGHCIQYRAHIIRGGGASTVTPSLLSVAIETEVAGSADINIPENGFAVTTGTDNQISSMVVQVWNRNIAMPSETITVEQARVANGLPSEGELYAHLCIARSNLDQPFPSLTLPTPNNFQESDKATCPYFAKLFTYETALNNQQVIDLLQPNSYDKDPVTNVPLSRWFISCPSSQVCTRINDIKSVFKKSGNYRVGLILDARLTVPGGIDNVPESEVGEANNQSSTITFTIIEPYTVALPMVIR